MSNVATLPATTLSGQQLQLIRRTIANDCNDAEFDLFMAAARAAGLDPFRKQISPLVFNKQKPDKRRMSIITTIDGLRVIAARSGRYRPDEAPLAGTEPRLRDLRKARADDAASDPQTVQGHSTMARTISSTTATASTS